MDAEWQPAHPTQWMTPMASGVSLSNNDSSGHWARFTELNGKSVHEVLYRLEEDLGAKVWKNASTAHNGSGLELGLPNFDPASKAHAKLIKNGDYNKARALELIVNNKVWSNQRLMDAGIINTDEQLLCGRCGLEAETDYHRYYACEANHLIDHEDVSKTNFLAKEAKRRPHLACLWFRAIMPGNITSLPVGWAPIDDGDYYDPKFKEWLNATGKVGTDGTGGIDNDPRTRRTFSGAAVLNP